MNAAELARRYVEGDGGALYEWEDLIANDPENAWPVFEQIVALQADDETLYQVSHRLRYLLHHYWNDFHERAEALVCRVPRFERITGPDFFDPEQYREKPLDIEELIRAHEEMDRHSGLAHQVDDLMRADPDRGLAIAVEFIHRGPAEGFDSFDTFSPLHDLFRYHGAAIIARVEEIARDSYLVRRALWRMSFSQRAAPAIDAEVWSRIETANRGTTDFTDDDEPPPAPRRLSKDDEALIAAWFEYERNFWAFSLMGDLVDEDPETAFTVLLLMLERTDDPHRIGYLAAGPLEDLLHRHAELLGDRISAEAETNEKLRQALEGVWL